MSPEWPPVLANYPWLTLFGDQWTIVLLYDRQGKPLWAANRNRHPLTDVVEGFLSASLGELFDAPGNDLYALAKNYADAHHGGDLGKVSIESLTRDPSLHQLPVFASRNIVEDVSLLPYFVIDFPQSVLRLAMVTPDYYLGVIRLYFEIARLGLDECRNIVLADDGGRIIGYSGFFSQPLNLTHRKSLLGKSLSEVLAFSRDPFLPPSSRQKHAVPDFVQWTSASHTSSFQLEDPQSASFESGPQFVQWKNISKHDYSYFRCQERLPVDREDFEVDIAFRTSHRKIPNLILRGVKRTTNRAPDILGYMLTNTPHSDHIRFRKNTYNVKFMDLPPLVPDWDHRLTVRKTGNVFEFLVDGQALGQWLETYPFILDSDDLVYLFLRPGEEIRIQSIAIRKSGEGKNPPAHPPLTAAYADPALDRQFNVSLQMGTVRETNFVKYQLDDVTLLKKDIHSLQHERDHLTARLHREHALVGHSPLIQSIRENLKQVARSGLSVLIEGETGTGKEVLARMIHGQSPAAAGPFIKIDCSTIPAPLIESELFGHEKGAFTGATVAAPGRFEQAQDGTVFLDEISSLPLDVQAKLLTVLQDNKIQRVGGTRPIELNFRLISATNVPLSQLIGKGLFREDLFYRLNQYRLELPPLRERRQDIPFLTEQFVGEANGIYRKKIEGVAPKAVEKLLSGRWRGNVRELRNVIFRAVIFAKEGQLKPSDIAMEESAAPLTGTKVGGARRRCRVRKEELAVALKEADGFVVHAAKRLNISRPMIYRLIKRFGLEPESFRN